MSDQNSKDVESWLRETAASKSTPAKVKLVFDPKSKKLVAMPSASATPDKALEFTAEEAKRFAVLGEP